jgi:hypothetical protein
MTALRWWAIAIPVSVPKAMACARVPNHGLPGDGHHARGHRHHRHHGAANGRDQRPGGRHGHAGRGFFRLRKLLDELGLVVADPIPLKLHLPGDAAIEAPSWPPPG